MNFASSDISLLLLNLVISSTLVLAVTATAARLMRRADAPLRHGVLTAGLVVLASVPVITAVANHWNTAWFTLESPAAAMSRLPAPSETVNEKTASAGSNKTIVSEMEKALTVVPSAPSFELEPTPIESVIGTGTERIVLSPNESPINASYETTAVANENSPNSIVQHVFTVLAAVWFMGIAIVWARLVYSAHQLRKLSKTFCPPDDPRLARLVRCVAKALGMRRKVQVLTSAAVPAPLSLGLVRPTIVLPTRLASVLDSKELESILTHELAHIARRDHWWGAIQHAVLALYWWHPLARWLGAALDHSREEVCDNFVLCRHVDRRSYAELLLDMAERTSLFPASPLTAGLLPPWHSLEDRVCGLLDQGRKLTTALSRQASSAILLAAVALSCLVCSVRVAYGNDAKLIEAKATASRRDLLADAAKGDAEAMKELRAKINKDAAAGIAILRAGAASGDKTIRDLATRELLRIGSDEAMAALETAAAKTDAVQATDLIGAKRSAVAKRSAAAKLEDTFGQIEYAVAKLSLAGKKEKAAGLAKELAQLRKSAGQTAQLPKLEELPVAMHSIGVYKGKVDAGDRKKKHPTGTAVVKVTDTSQPVMLLLSSYEPVKWKIEMTEGVTIESVVLSGYYRQSVEGLPEGVKVTAESWKQGNKCLDYLDLNFPDKARRKIRAYMGVGTLTLQGGNRARAAFEIGPGNAEWRAQMLLPRADALLRKATGKGARKKLAPEMVEWQNKLDEQHTAMQAVRALAKMESPAAQELLYRWIREQVKDSGNGGLFFGALPALELLNDKRAVEELTKLMEDGIPGNQLETEMLATHGRKSLLKMARAGNSHAASALIANAESKLSEANASRQEKFREFYTLYELAQGGNQTAKASLAKVKTDSDKVVAEEASALLSRLDAKSMTR